MGKFVVLSAIKASAIATLAFAVANFMGLPVGDPWFDVLVIYILWQAFLRSIVNGMPEPEEHSSPWYIWAYRSLHSVARIGTVYFAHKRMWKFLTGGSE